MMEAKKKPRNNRQMREKKIVVKEPHTRENAYTYTHTHTHKEKKNTNVLSKFILRIAFLTSV